MSSISGALLAEYNIFMRSSTLGRKSLKRIIETDGNPLEIKRMKVKDNYINANADIFNARLKGIGLKVKFVREGEFEPSMVEDVIMPLQIGKFTIYDTPLNKPMYNKLFTLFIKEMESISIMESYIGEKEDIVWKKVFEMDEVKKFKIPKETKEMIINASKNKGVDL